MRRAWFSELRVLIALLGAAAVVGILAGGPWWWIAAAAVLYLCLGLRNATRGLRWLRADSGKPPPDAFGLLGEIFGTFHQERRAARESEREAAARVEQYEQSAQALPDGVVVLDASMRIRWSNAAAERLLGLHGSEDRGQHIDNLVRHPEFMEFRQREDVGEYIEIPVPGAPDRVMMVGLVPFSVGQNLLICRDVTERSRLDRVRRDFVSNVSHELRTPIGVLGGYLEMIQDAEEDLPERWRRPVKIMCEQSERMRRLVEDLLLLSRMESVDKPTETEEVDMDWLLAQIRDEARELNGRRTHRVEVDAEPGTRIRGSGSEFRAIFSNLVRNAVQYTPDGGTIRIEWKLGDASVRFAVADDGEGIEPEHLSRLTERFYRVDTGRSREVGGTGLGLAIVKHALMHYDGKLEIESEPGHGSRFTCRFPRTLLVESVQAAESQEGEADSRSDEEPDSGQSPASDSV